MTSPRSTWRESLRRAFAMDSATTVTLSEEERELTERLCKEVVRRKMGTAAIMFIESMRPLAGVGAQALHFFQPFGTVFVDRRQWDIIAKFLEKRGAVEHLLQRIEAIEQSAPN
ncbi:MAG: hypothetical protein O2800_06290 [Planctomycetota bacterium]|nr:hypothetical protein [Planctomycetota bacterium]